MQNNNINMHPDILCNGFDIQFILIE